VGSVELSLAVSSAITHIELMIEWVIAGVVSVGVIAVGKAIVTHVAISRRQRHHLAQQTGMPPMPELELPARPLSGE